MYNKQYPNCTIITICLLFVLLWIFSPNDLSFWGVLCVHPSQDTHSHSTSTGHISHIHLIAYTLIFTSPCAIHTTLLFLCHPFKRWASTFIQPTKNIHNGHLQWSPTNPANRQFPSSHYDVLGKVMTCLQSWIPCYPWLESRHILTSPNRFSAVDGQSDVCYCNFDGFVVSVGVIISFCLCGVCSHCGSFLCRGRGHRFSSVDW